MSHSGKSLKDMLRSTLFCLCVITCTLYQQYRLKSDSHYKGELKPHSKPSDSHHSKPSDSHFKSVDSHSKSLDYHSDRKHGHQGSTPNKYHHRDHRHGNSEYRSSSGTNAHRMSSSHDKKPSEYNTSCSNRESSKPSRTPQKMSTGAFKYKLMCH